jgi:hypothetical protein
MMETAMPSNSVGMMTPLSDRRKQRSRKKVSLKKEKMTAKH